MRSPVRRMLSGRESLRLVVVPTDPISEYEHSGLDWIARYFNPGGMFSEVYALSPREEGRREAHGMTIIGVPEGSFAAALRALRPDVVRAYGGFWPSDLVTSQRVPGVPVVVSVHDTNPELLHRSVTRADLVVCMSRVVARCVAQVGVDPRRIRVLPNRVDLEVFRPTHDETLFAELDRRFPARRRILLVGRVNRQKNHDTLIRALALLPADYVAIMVGAGDRAPYLALAEQEGVAERCYWVDAVPNAVLPVWYTWCDCMCTPSRWEGFGIVFVEAAACGAAIVTSDIAPMNEFLKHDASACLVPEYERPDAIARAIQRVCEDATYRRVLSEGALRAAVPFDRRLVDETEVAIYDEALRLRAWPTSLFRLSRASLLAQRAISIPSRVTRRVKRLLSA